MATLPYTGQRQHKMATGKSFQKFPLVGVVASAGGIDSLERFLKAVPERSGMAYILVRHLPPDHDEIPLGVPAGAAKVPVREITDGCRLEPDHVYVIPVNKLPEVTEHSLKLTSRIKNEQPMPIDAFFGSLARVHGKMAAGVVLSGTFRDGAIGLGEIKKRGGITFTEGPGPATRPGMPMSAVWAGAVDFVLTPEEIPPKLVKVYAAYGTGNGGGPGMGGGGLKEILSVVRSTKGMDLSYYKKQALLRRIERRMAINLMARHEDYLELLREDGKEQEALLQDLLVEATSFFKDPEDLRGVGKGGLPKASGGPPGRRGDPYLGRGLRHRRGSVLIGHFTFRGP